MGALGPGETALIVISSGLHSHRGTEWKQTGRFDRLTIVQGEHPPCAAGGRLHLREATRR